MASTKAVILQLLLVSLASASHFYGGTVTFTAKVNSNGTYGVEIRNRATYDWCGYNYGPCYQGNCGSNDKVETGLIDRSNNAPRNNNNWCESETIITKTLTSDKPFQLREYSCCWVWQSPGYTPSWSLLTSVDLGRRSDTNKPNNSPDVAILPFLRVPQNCRRTYSVMAYDADGDLVRCRYGTARYTECYECRQHNGFHVDQATCTMHYLATAQQGVYGFELVVEDLPRNHINLYYSDGTSAHKHGINALRKRRAYTTTPWWWMYGPTTSDPHTTTTDTPTTTTDPPTTTSWWWAYTTTTTDPPTTTTDPPTTTTDPPTTTTDPPTTTTDPPTTTQTTTPWWWAYSTTTTDPPTTTTDPPTTTTDPPTTTQTTTPWWWAYSTTTTTPYPTTTTTPYPTTTTWPTTTPLGVIPFSQLPLQFTFQVDPPAPSCTDGEYLPTFVPPTPHNGQVILAEAGKEMEIRVKAQATHSVLDNIIMSGPLNVSKHRTTGDEFLIRWTPIQENRGNYFPICFAVEFTYGSAIYQSELRCVLVNVTTGVVKTNVICEQSSMRVEVERASLPQIHEDHLRLTDPSNTACSLQKHSNSTHIVAVVPLNACGTQIEEDDDNLIFKNEITTVENMSSIITRKHLLELQFFCQYPKRGNVTLGFIAHREKVTVWDKGLGQFTYGFEFYPNQQFQVMIDPRSYPLEYNVGEQIYMEIEATTTVNNTELFVDSCSASPYDNPNYHTTYTIIENGCNRDSTLIVYPSSNKRLFKFSLEAFKFIGLHDQVYISCSVLMCEAGNPNTRCSQGCLNTITTTPSESHHHRKREAVIQSATHFVSQGPLRLRRSAETTERAGLNLNLNLAFITGCALVAVGMICGVLLYKSKRSNVKYQSLPTCEN